MSSPQIAIADLALATFEWLRAKSARDQQCADGWVNERDLSDELTAVFNKRGVDAAHQQCYPASRTTCDVVCQLGEDAELWLEIKGAWLITHPFVNDDGQKIGGVRNPNYKKHLFHPAESAWKDLTQKSMQIVGSRKFVGVLLIGFDSTALAMDNDITELIDRADLAIEPWTLLYRGWNNPLDNNYRTRCWFWYRPANALLLDQGGEAH